jgi:hypothetical protein
MWLWLDQQTHSCLTVTKPLSWASDGAWHQERLADWPSVVTWLCLLCSYLLSTTTHKNYSLKQSDKVYMVSIKYKCPHLDAAWVRLHSCEFTVQQMCHPLRKTNPSSRRKGYPISKHINGLGTNINLFMGLTGPETKNDCAGEDQQQFIGLDWTGDSESWIVNRKPEVAVSC